MRWPLLKRQVAFGLVSALAVLPAAADDLGSTWLRDTLARYRAIADAGGWSRLEEGPGEAEMNTDIWAVIEVGGVFCETEK